MAGGNKTRRDARRVGGDEAESSWDSYPRPSVAVDVAVLTVAPESWIRRAWSQQPDAPQEYSPQESEQPVQLSTRNSELRLAAVVLKRQGSHRKGQWSLPGSFLLERERIRDAVLRTLDDKCGIVGLAPQQLAVLDDPDRDERGWVISIAHVDVVPVSRVLEVLSSRSDVRLSAVVDTELVNGDDGPSPVVLAGVDSPLSLPFDHGQIVDLAVANLRSRYAERPDPARLLPEPFTLFELRRVHEAVHGHELQKDTFRRWMAPYLHDTGEVSDGSIGRPAALYRHLPSTS